MVSILARVVTRLRAFSPLGNRQALDTKMERHHEERQRFLRVAHKFTTAIHPLVDTSVPDTQSEEVESKQ